MDDPGLFSLPEPLAARMRPHALDACLGQDHVLAPGRPLGDAIRRGEVGSIILWGPPGSGKTTLAFLIARYTKRRFVAFSAVTEGIPRVRAILAEAEADQRAGRGTILFCDEIHRFNKAQQDAFLPAVERGIVSLVGATTENPSFEVTSALLSRCSVYVLKPLGVADLSILLHRALADTERGLGARALAIDATAIELAARHADGDARRALALLEAAAGQVTDGGRITQTIMASVLARRVPLYDKGGEEHYNQISALHKAVRGSDPQGTLYWMARMLEAGEDPLYLARRLIRMAAEDIGLADPHALQVAVAARDAYHVLGSPEGDLALAQAALYLATAPKSNRVYRAWEAARAVAAGTPAAPVPLHLRNAPTPLMRSLGYGRGYVYDPDAPGGVSGQRFLPEELGEERAFYEPGGAGYERRIAARLSRWAEQLRGAAQAASGGEPSAE